jgi:hypothetical protein
VIHRANPELDDTDAYFATGMRAAIRDQRPRRALSVANLFTAGVRMIFEDWVDAGEPNLEFVADCVARFLIGPVSEAYEALVAEPAAKNDVLWAGPAQPKLIAKTANVGVPG